jgi:lipoate-protein ligase A
MQIIALPRTLQICRRPSPAAIRGSQSFSPTRLTSLAASREYHASRILHTKTDGQASQQSTPTSDHPLSIPNLRSLTPDVPHTFFSRSTSPYFNLAVEHHLLTHSNPSSRILFTYTNTPCVVIGRNQNPWTECHIRTIAKGTADGRHVEFIRRRSGGGAVFHDEGNLNYTVIVPAEGFERRTHVQMVVDALSSQQAMEDVPKRWREVKVTDRNDIVARLNPKYAQEGAEEDWFKVSGTAFKLTRGRALHHGTLLHSSPYIDTIGGFLRSPGKDYITAKGVESVRSPVTNLWNAHTARQRRHVAFSVRKAIERVWAGKYGGGSSKMAQIGNGEPEQLIPELMAGMQELKTQAWRWDQTPGFSFDSKDIVILGESIRLAFEVKNGLVQSVQASDELQATYEQRLVGKTIWELSATGNWKRLLREREASSLPQKALLQLLVTCFPDLKREDPADGSPRETKTDIEKPRESPNPTITSNTRHAQEATRLHRNETRLISNLVNAIARQEELLKAWSTTRQRLYNIGEPRPRAGNIIRKMGGMWLNLVVDDLAKATNHLTLSIRDVDRILEKLLRPTRNRARREANVKFTPMHKRLDAIAAETRGVSRRLVGVLTRALFE